MRWVTRIAVVAVVAWLGWWAWQRVFVTDEQRVHRVLSMMAKAVEAGHLLQLEAGIASDYTDDFGLDKGSLIGAVRTFRAQYATVFIHLADLKITVEPDHQKAQAVLIAKILAKAKGALGETEIRADRYRLTFRKTNDGWKMTHAESPQLKFE